MDDEDYEMSPICRHCRAILDPAEYENHSCREKDEYDRQQAPDDAAVG